MTSTINNVTRLLFGALLLFGSILISKDVSSSTFLFCLNSSDSVLSIELEKESFKLDNKQLNQILHDIGVTTIQEWIPGATEKDRHGDIYLNRIYRAFIDDNENVDNVMAKLESAYPLLYVEHENLHSLHYNPNDPSYDQQCSMSSVKADKAWDIWNIPEGIIPEGQEVLLASVDTGVDYTHPDLKASLWVNQAELPEWSLEAGIDLNGDGYVSSTEIEEFLIIEGMDNNADGEVNLRDLVCEGSGFLDGFDADGNGYTDDIIGWDASGYYANSPADPDPYPREGATPTGTWAHGTHVAGILAATTDNGVGISSTSYNAKIISVKVSRGSQPSEPGISDGYAGITYAAKAGYYSGTLAIINNSWGGGSYSFSENTVIQNAHDTYGAVVLSSAGNGDTAQGEYSKEYPAAYDNVLSVCAIGCSGAWGGWATYHETVDLAAPGESILSTIIGQGYEAWDGSSMACPNAASVIGLMKAYYPDWNNVQLIDRVLSSSDRFIYDLNPEYEVSCMTDEGTEWFCDDENGNPINCECLGVGMVDAYAAIAIDFSPNINLESYSYNIINGDGDDVLNPGDVFELTLEIKNEEGWSNATNIIVNVSASDENVVLNSSLFNFDSMDSGESLLNTIPVNVDVGSGVALGDLDLIIDIVASGSDSYLYNQSLFLSIPVSLMQSGYPFDTNSQVDSSPLAVDLDGNGSLEVVFGDYAGLVHVLSSDGTPWNEDIFPYDTGNQIWSSPASADIDNDGLMDFVIASKNKHLYGFDQNGLKFDYDADQFLIGTPAIGNIDADDDLEVVIGGYTSSGDVFAVNPDGTDVDGFPIQLNEKIWKGVALHDFNGNGLDDIVVTTDGDDLILLIYDDGTMETLLIADDKFKSSPSIVKSGDDYVIMAGSYDDNMHAVSSTGEAVFTVDTGDHVNSSASFINLNGAIYAFFGSDNGMLYAVDMEGNDLNGWPQNIGGSIDNSVSFADLDGDGFPEAIVGASGQLYAYHMDGTMYTHFPVSYEFSFTSAPLISDIDQDGDLELVVGSAGSLVSIDIMENGSVDGYWNQDRSNNQKTGFYEVVESECSSPMLGDVNCDTLIDVLDILMMVNTIINESDTTDYQGWASDLNQDGIIDILDVLNIVDLIIN